MDKQEVKRIFDELYQDVDGLALSREGRGRLGYYDQSHFYGEVLIDSFYEILNRSNPKEGEIFYDLGSGLGKAVLLAHLFYSFSECVGIEIIPELFGKSCDILDRFNRIFREQINQRKKLGSVRYMNADFHSVNFLDADVIFANSTCFYPEIFTLLGRQFERTKKGTRIIVLTNPFFLENFQLYHTDRYEFSWGHEYVYFYKHI